MTRKIDEQAAFAFLVRKAFKSKNTEVRVEGDGRVSMWLHGNRIAWTTGSVHSGHGFTLCTTLAGWNTPTTRARLNALIGRNAYYQKNRKAFFDGTEISASSVQES